MSMAASTSCAGFLRNAWRNSRSRRGGGAHYGMICDAAYPSYVLAEYTRNGRVPVQRAISMLARETAAAVGLHDRGIIQAGFKADLNVINLDKTALACTQHRYDLPGNGRRLDQRADGYEATIVSGEITYQHGKPTGALPGRLVRGARPNATIVA